MSGSTDPEREHRIETEIVVDAYDAAERALGWYYYLDDRLEFPFEARCIAERSCSPLHVGDTFTVESMADEVSAVTSDHAPSDASSVASLIS